MTIAREVDDIKGEESKGDVALEGSSECDSRSFCMVALIRWDSARTPSMIRCASGEREVSHVCMLPEAILLIEVGT